MLQPDQHGPRRLREDLIRHRARNLLLSCNAFRTEKRWSYLPNIGEQDVLEENRGVHGGVYR